MAMRGTSIVGNRLWGIVLTGLLLMVLGLSAAAGQARAATSNISVSADPTEDKPATLTISGQTEANRKLWVVVFPSTSNGCEYTNANLLTYTQSDRTVLINGDSLATDNYQRTVDYTPPESRAYLVCSFVASGLYDTPSVRASHIFQVRKPNVTSSVAFSSDPTEDKPVTVTITGQTEVQRGLWVVAFRDSSHRCDSTNASQLVQTAWESTVLLRDEPLPAGTFERTATFTPPDTARYRVCAFVADGSQATPDVRTGAAFDARAPKVTANIGISGDPADGKPVTATITGQTEVQRSLWVIASHGNMFACSESTARQLVYRSPSREVLLENIPLPAGAFQRTVTFTPKESGSYKVCAYTAESDTATPNTKTINEFPVRDKQANMTVVPVGSFQHLSKSSFYVEGVTEAAGQVTVFLQNQTGPCPAKAGVGTEGTIGESVKGYYAEPGRFAVDGWFIPRMVMKHRICVYLTDEKGTTVGMASTEVAVERNPAFLPKLITPNMKRSKKRPPTLKWKSGPGVDHIEIFRVKPKEKSRSIRLKRGVITFKGGEEVGRWTAKFSKRFLYPAGRYWWRIRRQDPESGYSETSAPRAFVVVRSRR